MRALFIIHCQDPIYGASRSISALIRNLDADVDIIFPIKIKQEGRITQEQIRKYYGERVRNVWYLPQPARLTVIDTKVPFEDQIKSFIKELLFCLFKFRYKKVFAEGQYSFIHLNSVTLYSMLDRHYPMFLHVREKVRSKKCFRDVSFSWYCKKAHGIFLYEDSVKKSFPALSVPQKVLVNPFDQRYVKLVDAEKAYVNYDLDGAETIYAIIGSITPFKGVKFVMQAFQKANLEKAVLLIVGQDTHHRSYEKEVYKMAASDHRIRILGEVENTDTLYKVIDYVVRGDTIVGYGRTTYEGLYSGCGAILQYEMLSDQKIPNITPEMQHRITFYKLQDEASLTDAFRKTQGKKMTQRQYYSNIEEYTGEFLNFIRENT